MSEIRFFITEQAVNDLEVDDYEALERAQDGDVKMYRLRRLMCRFMVDENNQPVPFEQALKITGKLKIAELKDFTQKFFAAMQERAVPKESGSLSKSPTEAVQADSPSLAG
jgi:hypothetical protein